MTLRHAYENVPFYRRAFDPPWGPPGDLRELSDVSRFPLTTKQDLRDNYPFGMFAVPRERLVGCTRPAARPGNPPWLATPRATSMSGPS